MNSITIAGALGKDSELRSIPSGDQVLSFSVADSQGRDKPTTWWSCQLWGKRAATLQQYLAKGQQVTVDYAAAQDLTHGLLERAACPDGLPFALVRDADKKGLRLRITKAGGKHWQFETRIKGKLFTRALGEWPAVSIDDAKAKAHRLRGLTEKGTDPREAERQQQADKAAAIAAAAAQAEADKLAAVTVSEVWATYIDQRRPNWGDLHYRDHIDKAKAGGLPSGRRGGGKQLTRPGPLAALMPLALKDLDQATIERWAAKEGKTRASSARLAWRLLTVFLTWCGEQKEYASLLPAKNPAKTKKSREALGKAGVKKDVLQRGQLAAWFAAVQQLQNPVIATCIQMMLHLLAALPRRTMTDPKTGRQIANPWVFPSPTSATGCLTEPNNPHTRACIAAGLEGLTLHGLRRSFKSLTEWLEVPVGVVAQIQGHKPSATAEKHYTVRPLELLRLHHERIEAWILEQAGLAFDAKAAPGALRVVTG